MFVKLVRVEMTADNSSNENTPDNRGRTFRKIILSIGTQRKLLESVQLVHDVTVDLCMISPLKRRRLAATYKTQPVFWDTLEFCASTRIANIAQDEAGRIADFTK